MLTVQQGGSLVQSSEDGLVRSSEILWRYTDRESQQRRLGLPRTGEPPASRRVCAVQGGCGRGRTVQGRDGKSAFRFSSLNFDVYVLLRKLEKSAYQIRVSKVFSGKVQTVPILRIGVK